jgi:acyl-CoA synthetase (AMP-forming)/AMP-acid ligase II
LQIHLASQLEQVAGALGDKPALIHGDLTRSWREFDDRAARLTSALMAGGVVAGDSIAIVMYNGPEWLETFYAAIKCRAIPANINYRYREEELLFILRDCSAKVVVFHARLAEAILRVIPQMPEDTLWIIVDDETGEPADLPAIIKRYELLISANAPAPAIERSAQDSYLSYTGGTTGLPKGVLMNVSRATLVVPVWYDILFGIAFPPEIKPGEAARLMREAGRDIIALVAPPLMHSTGLGMTALPALGAGGTVVTLTSTSYDATEMLAAIEKHRVNWLTIVGDVFARPMVRAIEQGRPGGGKYDLECLKVISSAGVAWTASIKSALLEQLPGVMMMEACGASEGVAYGSRIAKAGSTIETGRFDPSDGLKLLAENGEILPREPGQVGLLAAPAVANGYLNQPEKSAQMYREIDGVLHATPGDYGRWEEDGSFTLLGRRSAVINTGGEKVHPDEVEDVIKQMGIAEDCLVFGIPDETWGQSVAAMIQLHPAANAQVADVIAYVKRNLAAYKAPRHVMFVERVPRGPNAKGDYQVAARMMEASLVDGADGAAAKVV